MPKLSIIIPCYNCQETLKEAVDSCFSQGFTEEEFEIVLVDDASTDSTVEIMTNLQSAHGNIRLSFHESNQGGGATRNTAVKHASAEVIFCLDSDDLLPPNTLDKMYEHLIKKNCDGVGVSKSIKFIGTDISNISTVHKFIRVNEIIILDDLLQRDGLCSLYSTFMFTKVAFLKTGGYPIHHGFDTQGFAWRFLAAGLHGETCPDTSYLHRIQFHESYYLREYNNGKVNFNWLEIFKEHFHLFSDEVQQFIISFNYSDFTQDFFHELIRKGNIFITTPRPNKTTYQYNLKQRIIARNSLTGVFYRVRQRARSWFGNNLQLKNAALSTLFFYQDIAARVNSKRATALILNYLLLRYKKLLKLDFDIKYEPKERLEKIDIVIPTTGKDFVLFDTYLKYLKSNLCHDIENIYVVAPAHEKKLIDYCSHNNLVFIDETQVLGYGKSFIDYNYNGINRSGWLFQQLLKLSGDKFVKNHKYIIVDSDTLLIHKHQFYNEERYVFFENTEWNEPYFRSFNKLFGYEAPHRLSLTSHMMIFDTKMLEQMKKEIENKHNMSWDKAYTNFCDKTVPSGISDYDTYAQWLTYNHPDKVIMKPFYNKSMKRTYFFDNKIDMLALGKKVRTLSLHSYN